MEKIKRDNDNYAEIYALYIDKEYQRKGIGTALINFAFENLKPNYKYVLISTLVQNDANLFYKKIGGKLIDKVKYPLLDYLKNVRPNVTNLDYVFITFDKPYKHHVELKNHNYIVKDYLLKIGILWEEKNYEKL